MTCSGPATTPRSASQSPIVTWGNAHGTSPAQVSVFLRHLASYGFTVIASTLPNTGSGNEIDAAAHYLVAQNGVAASVFHGHLNVSEVAAAGTSQGATGAVRAGTNDPALIKTVMTFSLPGADLGRAQPGLPDRRRLHGEPGRADPSRLLRLHPRFLGLDHRQPGHREGLLPQHLGTRRARHHPQLRRRAGRPRRHPERRGRREPRRLLRLRHRLARVSATRQCHRGRGVHRPAPRAAVEQRLAEMAVEVSAIPRPAGTGDCPERAAFVR